MLHTKKITGVFICSLFSITSLLGCDGGLAPPPPAPPAGAIHGTIEYSGQWPPADSLHDLRFVAFKIPPQTTSDFLDLGNLIFSERLNFFVDSDTFFISDVDNDTYRYNVIAQQYGPIITANWRPVGVYTENDGIFSIRGDTTQITIEVDFSNPPPFPPE